MYLHTVMSCSLSDCAVSCGQSSRILSLRIPSTCASETAAPTVLASRCRNWKYDDENNGNNSAIPWNDISAKQWVTYGLFTVGVQHLNKFILHIYLIVHNPPTPRKLFRGSNTVSWKLPCWRRRLNSQAWNHNHPGSLLARHNPPGLETPLQNSQSEWHHAAFLNSLAW